MKLGSISLTARLAIGFVIVLVLAHVAICMYLDYAFQEEFLNEDRQILSADAAYVSHVVGTHSTLEDIQRDSARLGEIQSRHPGLLILLKDTRGLIAAASKESGWLADLKPEFVAHQGSVPTLFATQHDGRHWRILRSEAALSDLTQPLVALNLALDVTSRDEFASRYRSRLVAAAVIAALVAGAIGFPLVRNALEPLSAMAKRANEISASRLNERLPTTDVPAELEDFSAAFNRMLERLQDSFRRLSQFSSDLAHDLRTPISNLMGEAQVAMSRTRPIEEYQAILASAIEEYERITRMIEGMLFLARADDGTGALRCELLDGGHQMSQIAEYYEGLLEESGLTLRIEGQAPIWGNADLLRRAVSNLVSNSISHTPRGGQITITLSGDKDGTALISVRNPGPGIPPESLPRVFDRFFRADAARGGSHKGSGLGLAIVKSIIELHGGSVGVESVVGKETTFSLRVPRQQNEHWSTLSPTAAPQAISADGRTDATRPI